MNATVTMSDVAKQSFLKRVESARAQSQVVAREEREHVKNLTVIFSRKPAQAKEK